MPNFSKLGVLAAMGAVNDIVLKKRSQLSPCDVAISVQVAFTIYAENQELQKNTLIRDLFIGTP